MTTKMKINVCITCSSEVPEIAFFCPSCASQVKCKKCNEQLVKNAKACISCGTLTDSITDRTTSTNGAMNTIKFRETKEERSYEVAFTNHVGKEVSELVANMVKNNFQNKALQSASNNGHKENLGEKDTIDLDVTSHSESKVEVSDLEISNFPPLNDIEMTFDCSEIEWIAIYAFYISKYGTSTFSKDQVYEKYKDKRYTETRRKNFSTNWKGLFNSHITTIKEDEFRFKPEGVKIVTQLLKGSSGNDGGPSSSKKSNEKVSKTPAQRKTMPKSVVPEEFDAFNKKKSLENHYNEKQPGKNTGYRILVISYYITRINGSEYFTDGNIEYAYKALGLSGRPNFLHQTLLNLESRKVWFEKIELKGKNAWKLSRIGESFVDDKLPESKKEK